MHSCHSGVTYTPLHGGRLKCNLCKAVIKRRMTKGHRNSCPHLPQKKQGINNGSENNHEQPLLVKIVRYNPDETASSSVKWQCPFCTKEFRLISYSDYEKVTCSVCRKEFILKVERRYSWYLW